MCYANTGKRKDGEKSAYSIFNENAEAYGTKLIWWFAGTDKIL